MSNLPPPEVMLAIAVVIFFGIGLHEYAHCKMADVAGDPTPRYYGRVTLNLFKHFEPLGTLMILITSLTGIGIGWGKASPINPARMRNPRWDSFAAVAAGPISNLIQATVWALMLRVAIMLGLMTSTEVYGLLMTGRASFPVALLTFGVLVNLGLMIFNLIPLGPLDGHWILGAFLPDGARERWMLWNRRAGSMLLLGVIILSQVTDLPVLYYVIGIPRVLGFKFMTGL